MLKSLKIYSSFLIICFFQKAAFSQDPRKDLTNELGQLSSNSSIEGCAAAIFTSDSLLYSHGFGYSSVSLELNYSPDTRQKIASLSKLVLGVSVMKAQEMNLLDLDDNVNDYLPFELTNPYHPDKDISIRNLVTHTASLNQLLKNDLRAIYSPSKLPIIKSEMPFGFRRIVFNRFIKSINTNQELSLKDFLFNLYAKDGEWYSKSHFIKKEPGKKTLYSNAGASLVALIIEEACKMKYEDFVQQYVFDPLKMNQTFFDFNSNNLASNSSELYHGGIQMPNDYRLLLYPAGGIESTVSDFSIFMKNIVNGIANKSPILSKESISELLKPQLGNLSHGVFWETSENYIGHSGDIIGVTTFAYYNFKLGIGYLLFCNTGGTKGIYKETRAMRSKLKEYFPKFISN